MYLPLHNVTNKKYIVRIPGKFCFYTVGVPIYAFIVCVFLTMVKDFESANRTHCNVPNIFPSISASIGSYEPQNTIWKTAIYLHSPLRFVIVYLRWINYKKIIRQELDIIINFAVFLNVIENLALIGLTHWTSSGNYPYHEKCFITFIATSVVYMFLVCILLSKYRRRPTVDSIETQSIRLKKRLFVVNVTSFAFAGYFFVRHNSMCEPFVYSLFGFAEYIVVLSNMGFHMTTTYDLPITYIYLTKYGIDAE